MLHIEVRNMIQYVQSIDGSYELPADLKPDLINVDYYIQMTYGDLRVDNQLLKDAIKDVDDTEADGLTIVSEYIGGSGIYDLSTGCKGLIIMYHEPEKHTFCTRFYGENCAQWIYKIAYGDKKYGNKPRDVYMVMQTYIPNVFEFFKPEDEIEIDGKIYTIKDNPRLVLFNEYCDRAVFEPEKPFEIDWTGIDKSQFSQEEIDRLTENGIQPMTDARNEEYIKMVEEALAKYIEEYPEEAERWAKLDEGF